MTAAPRVRTGTSPAGFRTAFGVLAARAAPVLLLALTVLVVAYQLGRKSLWHDEAFTLAVARSDPGTFGQTVLGRESFAALYYSVIRLLPWPGDSEAGLRAPSVVFAAVTVLACHAVARRLFGPRVALIAALLLSVNVFFLKYAQEARAYALVLCVVTLAAWTLVRAVEEPTWPRWIAFGAVSATAAYAHFFATFVLAGHLLSLLAVRSTVPLRRVAGAVGLVAVLVLPLAVVLARTNAGGRPKLPQASIPALSVQLAGISPTQLGVLQAAVYALCGLGAAWAVLRRPRVGADPVAWWRYWLVACWLTVPVALAALVSVFWPVFVTRYFVVCLPAVVLLVAVGLEAARPALQAVALAILLLAAAQGMQGYYAQSYKEGENWRALVQQVDDDARPGDSVVFLSRYGRRPFEYYLTRQDGLVDILTPAYPSLPWGHYPPVVGEVRLDPLGDRARFESARPDRVWIVLLWGGFRSGDDDGASFVRFLADGYDQIDHRFYGEHLKLALFQRIEDPSAS